MELIYVSAPYTSDNDKIELIRKNAIDAYTAYLLSREFFCISMVTMCHDLVLKYKEISRDPAFWDVYSRRCIHGCSELHVLKLPGWEKSKGVAGEIDEANKLNIPVIFIEPLAR